MGGKRVRGGKKGEKKGRDESPIIFFLGKSRLHFSGAASCFPPRTGLFFFKKKSTISDNSFLSVILPGNSRYAFSSV